jgi:hypothetical protein
MRNQGRTRGWSVVGLIAALCSAATVQAGTTGRILSGLEPEEVGRSLAGEWEGQIQVYSPEGKLSAAPASMSAKLSAGGEAVEVYYEGFAFGKPIEGAMIFSFVEDDIEANLHDEAVNLRATCRPDDSDSESDSEQSYQVRCDLESNGEFRVVFTRLDAKAWSIAYESREPRGEWSSMLTLQMDRLGAGQRSAAADGSSDSAFLLDLRGEAAMASVDGED